MRDRMQFFCVFVSFFFSFFWWWWWVVSVGVWSSHRFCRHLRFLRYFLLEVSWVASVNQFIKRSPKPRITFNLFRFSVKHFRIQIFMVCNCCHYWTLVGTNIVLISTYHSLTWLKCVYSLLFSLMLVMNKSIHVI